MAHIHEKIYFTVEVFVVYGNKVLLRKHDKYGIWLSVGGHIELDEDPNQAALREVREEVGRIVQASGSWDGGTWGLQVTDATDRTLELRALMSAADSSAAWDLRCEVREKLVEYMRREHPQALPRFRVEEEPEEPRGA